MISVRLFFHAEIEILQLRELLRQMFTHLVFIFQRSYLEFHTERQQISKINYIYLLLDDDDCYC